MHTYTALYDNRQDAEAAQQQLKSLGIIDANGMNIADQSAFADTGQSGSGSGSDGRKTGFWGSLLGAAPPADDRRMYEEGVRQGGYLLTVNVDDQNAERVEDLLERTNAVDIDEREQQYRSSGILPPTGMAAKDTTMGRTEGFSGTGDQSIPIVQEELKVGKRAVERGGVRVRSYVVETPVHEQVTLRQEHVDVERRPVNQPTTAGALGADMLKERTIEMTETSEEAVVAKDSRVVEEVVIRKSAEDRVETIDDTVRRTEVDVERMDSTSRKDGGPAR